MFIEIAIHDVKNGFFWEREKRNKVEESMLLQSGYHCVLAIEK